VTYVIKKYSTGLSDRLREGKGGIDPTFVSSSMGTRFFGTKAQ
jgi:hypothetical protein